MKFLQKLMSVIALFSLMAASQHDKNYSNSTVMAQVSCGKRIWTDGELLGRVNGDRVWTLIIENRIYIRKENSPDYAYDNKSILFFLDTRLFPIKKSEGQSVLDCVNNADPSTYKNKYLGVQSGKVIPCNNKPISDKLFLGVFNGEGHFKSFQYARIINGRLRVNLQTEGQNIGNYDALNYSLILATVDGKSGFMNPDMGFTLNQEEIKNCFWPAEPKTAVPVESTPACASSPSIQTISNITKTSLQCGFTSKGIQNVKWRIKFKDVVLSSGTIGTASDATKIDLTFESLNNGSYMLELEGGDCTSSVSSREFIIADTVLSAARYGGEPTISEITNVDTNSLRVSFSNTDIPNFSWKIKSGIDELANGKTSNLTGNSAILNFKNLITGTYTLVIESDNSKSQVSTMNFRVGDDLSPTYISNFEATQVKHGIDLTWNMVRKDNGIEFEILRLNSELNKSEIIGKIPQTEQGVGKYHFLDQNPAVGTNYYQLKQVSLEGKSISSKAIDVNFDQIFEAIVAPNPADEFVSIHFTSRSPGITKVEIYNIAGTKMITSQINVKEGKNVYRINTGKLTTGDYFIKLLTGNQKTQLRFLKAN